jgi:hypothetical protein
MASAVYASRADLAAALGMTGVSGPETRLDLALVIASRWVDNYLGIDFTQEDIDQDGTLTLTATDCPPAYKQAALAAASRFYKSTEIPYGVVGGLGDLAVRVKQSIPEAEVLLMGYRTEWGIA